MKVKDTIQVRDALVLSGGGQRVYAPERGEEIVQVEGFFSCLLRERGKIVPGSRRAGKNICTLTGREHLAQLMSYSNYSPLTPARNDRIKYVGMGTGTQPEVSTVTQVVTPKEVTTGVFLALLAIPTYPNTVSRSTVRFTRSFIESELSIPPASVTLTEAGLFTDGSPTASYAPGTRDLTFANAAIQAPNYYKSFEPLRKTPRFVLELAWEVRF